MRVGLVVILIGNEEAKGPPALRDQPVWRVRLSVLKGTLEFSGPQINGFALQPLNE
jgi:hypothetical protein